jgi:predicted DNA-binding protein
MHTISTKLDKQTAKRFLEVCNDEGKCQSEFLREMIEQMIETDNVDEENQELEIQVEDVKPTIEIVQEIKNPRIIYD